MITSEALTENKVEVEKYNLYNFNILTLQELRDVARKSMAVSFYHPDAWGDNTKSRCFTCFTYFYMIF